MADEKKGTGGGGLRGLAKAEAMVVMATAVPGGCFVGWALGALLDRYFHQNWMMIVGILLGAAGGFIQIFTMAQKYLKRGE